MVYARENRIQFGTGDVGILMSMAGTRIEPQAVVIFQSQAPEAIHGVEEGADLSMVRTGLYNPREDIAMSFSKPESIDCVISVLKAIKKATFGENNLVKNYLSD